MHRIPYLHFVIFLTHDLTSRSFNPKLHRRIYFMKHLFLFFFSGLIVNTAISQHDFVKYRDLQDRFEIAVPGDFKYTEKTIITPIGNVTNESLSLETEKSHPNTLYMLNIVTYPEAIYDFDSLESMEESLLNALNDVARVNHSPVIYKEISYDQKGLPTIIFRLMDKKKVQSIKGIIKLKPDQMYAALVYSSVDRSLNELADIYLKSLKILPE